MEETTTNLSLDHDMMISMLTFKEKPSSEPSLLAATNLEAEQVQMKLERNDSLFLYEQQRRKGERSTETLQAAMLDRTGNEVSRIL